MCQEFKYPEEVRRDFWIRELRNADGLKIDDYLEWLFFTKDESDDTINRHSLLAR